MKTIFGPVPSRRLGRSLGIDVIPAKTCSYDCIYCESGPTTRLTCKRRTFVAPEDVLRDLEEYFRSRPGGADALTFSSPGEPTLYAALGELIRAVKKRYPSLPLVVLTNGSLLGDPGVRKDLLGADRVVPSLDAVTREVFLKVNRPHPSLDLDGIIEGLKAFRREYTGELHLEVMVVEGVNDHEAELKAIARIADLVKPEEVELNTVVRPPADLRSRGLSSKEMEAISLLFPLGKTRIIGCFHGPGTCGADPDLDRRVLDMVKIRPCTAPEMAASLGVSPEDLEAVLEKLLKEGRLERHRFDDREYLRIPS